MIGSQSDSTRFLVKHNSVFVLVFSVIAGTIISYIAYALTGQSLLIFLIPFVTIVIMYYLKMNGTKQKLLAGVIIFLVTGIIAAGIASTSYYDTIHPSTYRMYNGGYATLAVDPFGGVSQTYNFSMSVTNLSSPAALSASLNITSDSASFNYSFAQLNHVVLNNDTVLVYKNVNNLPGGIYSYSFQIANGSSSPIKLNYLGPIIGGGPVLFVYLIPAFAFDFVVPNILILTALVFIIRSMERQRTFIDRLGSDKKK